jgi:hypothetical protein
MAVGAAAELVELLLDASVAESFEHADAPRSATAASPAVAIRLRLAEFIGVPLPSFLGGAVNDVDRRPR